ncbi:uncharacterized protein LOC143251655 [Tachypleus tridentatus]|uniref:uncharacterized protein LOC143251655 n=1 Tax=Tachypleus tridentatus TaxID=6853 RepID=UPI003FD1460A
MLKRLREKLAEEVRQFPNVPFPIQTQSNGEPTNKLAVDTLKENDLINFGEGLTNSTSNSTLLRPTPDQFSITDEKDETPSEPGTPHKLQADLASDSEIFTTPQSTPVPIPTLQATSNEQIQRLPSLYGEAQHIQPSFVYQTSRSNYMPQSDIESEVEPDISTLNLDGVSKEQLYAAIQKVQARLQKYRNKYVELVKAYRGVDAEKEKIKNALTESQDKALRRIGELREQCQLEQQAKAHLEQNLRLILEEKEDMIKVMEMKIKLLKEGDNLEAFETNQTEQSTMNLELCTESPEKMPTVEQPITRPKEAPELQIIKEKNKRLEILLMKCKDTIKSNKERIVQLQKETEMLSNQVEEKTKELQHVQEKEAEIQARLREELQEMSEMIEKLKKQQEESSMAMAETKRNMHEELEQRDQQLRDSKIERKTLIQQKNVLEKEVEELKTVIAKNEQQYWNEVNELQDRLKATEKVMEEEKQNLMHELSRGKAAAISLMKEELEKKISTVEEEWMKKIENLRADYHRTLEEKNDEVKKIVEEKELEFQKELEKRTEQVKLALEERDIQKVAAVSEMDSQNDKLLEEVEEMKSKRMELESQVTSLQGQLKEQAKCYQVELEKIKQSHLECIAILKLGDNQQTIIKKQQAINEEKGDIPKTCMGGEDSTDNVAEINKNTHYKLQLEWEQQVYSLQDSCKQNDSIVQNLKSLEKEIHDGNEKEPDAHQTYSDLQNELVKAQGSLKKALAERNNVIQILELVNQQLNNIAQENYGLQKLCDDKSSSLTSFSYNLEAFQQEKVDLVQHLNILQEPTAFQSEIAVKIEEYKNEIVELTNMLKHCEDEKRSLVKEAISLRKELDVCKKGMEDMHSFEEKFSELSEEKNKCVSELKRISDTQKTLITEKEAVETELKVTEENLNKVQTTLHQLSIERVNNEEKSQTLQEELKLAQEEKKTMSNYIKNLKTSLQEVENDLRKEKYKIFKVQSLENNINCIKTEKDILQREVVALRNSFEEETFKLSTELTNLKSKCIDLQFEKQYLDATAQETLKKLQDGYEKKLHALTEEWTQRIDKMNNESENNVSRVTQQWKTRVEEYENKIREVEISNGELKVRETNLCQELQTTKNEVEIKFIEFYRQLLHYTVEDPNQIIANPILNQLDSGKLDYKEKLELITEGISILMENLCCKKDVLVLQESLSSLNLRIEEFQRSIEAKEDKIRILKDEKSILEDKIKSSEIQWKEHEQYLNETLHTKLKDVEQQAEETVEALKSDLKQALEKLKVQEMEFETNLKMHTDKHCMEKESLKSIIKRLTDETNSLNSDAKKEVVKLNSEISDLKFQLETSQKTVEECHTELAKMDEGKTMVVQTLTKEWNEKLNKSVETFQVINNQLEESNKKMQENFSMKEKEFENLKKNYESQQEKANNDLDYLQMQIKDFQNQNFNMKEIHKKELETQEAKHKTEIENFQKKLNKFVSLTAELENLQHKLTDAEKCIEESKATHQLELDELQQHLQNKLDEKTRVIKKKEELLKDLEKNLNHQKRQNDLFQSKISEINELLLFKDQEIEKFSSFKSKYELLQKEYSEARLAMDAKEHVYASKCEELQELVVSVNVKDSQFKLLTDQCEKLKKDLELSVHNEQVLQVKLQDLKSQCNQYESTVSKLQSEIEFSHAKSVSSLTEKEVVISDYKNRLFTVTENYETLQKRIKNLEEELQEVHKTLGVEIEEKEVSLKNIQKIREEKKNMEEEFMRMTEVNQMKLTEVKKKAEVELAEIKKELQSEKENSEEKYQKKFSAAETLYNKEVLTLKEVINELMIEKQSTENKFQEQILKYCRVADLEERLAHLEEEKGQLKEKLKELQLQKEEEGKDWQVKSVESENSFKKKLSEKDDRFNELLIKYNELLSSHQESLSTCEVQNSEVLKELKREIEQEKKKTEEHLKAHHEQLALLEENHQKEKDELISQIENLTRKQTTHITLEKYKEKENFVDQLKHVKNDEGFEKLLFVETCDQDHRNMISKLKKEKEEANEKIAFMESEHHKKLEELEKQYRSALKTETEGRCFKEYYSKEKRKVIGYESSKLSNMENELQLRNNQLDESLILAEANQATVSQNLEKAESDLQLLQHQIGLLKEENTRLSLEVELNGSTVEFAKYQQKEKCRKDKKLEFKEKENVIHLKEENKKLKWELEALKEEMSIFHKLDNVQTSEINEIRKEFQQKLCEKDNEFKSKLKQLVQDFAGQIKTKEAEYEGLLKEAIDFPYKTAARRFTGLNSLKVIMQFLLEKVTASMLTSSSTYASAAA